tara:strand:- start:1995 stop:3548 length:1554 start_codon:yes stop_codon:yes gene_type:complete
MKVLIVYPNLPMMITPATSVGIFTTILKQENCDVEMFETTLYSESENQGMLFKSKLGGGRSYELKQLGFSLKPTDVLIPDFKQKVINYKPDLLLFSTVEDTFKDTNLLLESVEHLNIPHIVGGVFPINAPDVCINSPNINVICRYEGELVLSEVVSLFKQNKNWKKAKGLWYKENNKIIKNTLQPLADINQIIPDYSLYSIERFNRPIGGKVRQTIQFETFRGCPYSCTFCNSPMTKQLDKNYLRRKSITQVEKELDKYMEQFDPGYWFIIDDSFLARPKKETYELCELFQKYKIPWWCNTRLENIDEDILIAMKNGYCDRIQFGIECGNEKYRKNVLLRNVSNNLYYQKAKILNKSGIPYGLNVIIGLPGETRKMVFETIELIRKIEGYDGIGVSIFIPYYGTKLREYAIKNGWLDKNWISGYGYLLGGSAIKMPKPYLQNDEIWDLTQKFKLYCYFDKKYWDDITDSNNLTDFENIYNSEFYTKYAIDGDSHIKNRLKSIYACAASPQVDIHNVL